MYHKIYFNDKPLFLCDNIDDTISPYVHHDDAVFIDELDGHTIKSMIHEMQQPEVHAGVFYHPDLDKLKKEFFKKFTIVRAAGGIVRNENGGILIIYRRGFWDLPKGKLDKGETVEECAQREVKEETGLKKLTLLSPATITWHTYHEGTKFILKESHWFHMTASGEEELVPQAEENITEIKWLPVKEISSILNNTYPSVADILQSI